MTWVSISTGGVNNTPDMLVTLNNELAGAEVPISIYALIFIVNNVRKLKHYMFDVRLVYLYISRLQSSRLEICKEFFQPR